MDQNMQGMPGGSVINSGVPNIPSATSTDNVGISGDKGGKKIWPMIAVLAIVLVLVIAALIMFASGLNTVTPVVDLNAGNNSIDATNDIDTSIGEEVVVPPVRPITNTTDDVQSLENDLNSSLEGLDGQNF